MHPRWNPTSSWRCNPNDFPFQHVQIARISTALRRLPTTQRWTISESCSRLTLAVERRSRSYRYPRPPFPCNALVYTATLSYLCSGTCLYAPYYRRLSQHCRRLPGSGLPKWKGNNAFTSETHPHASLTHQSPLPFIPSSVEKKLPLG